MVIIKNYLKLFRLSDLYFTINNQIYWCVWECSICLTRKLPCRRAKRNDSAYESYHTGIRKLRCKNQW